MKKNAHEELVQEKKKRQKTEEKLSSAKKNQEKFYQMWRQTEREKEKLLHLQMKNKTKSINSSDSAVAVTKSFLEIPRELIHVNMDSDSKNLITLGEGKFGKVTLAYYREMPVAVKQFNEGVSQAEVEHEANIISSFNHLNLPVLFGISCHAKPFMLVLQFYGVGGKPLSLKDCFQSSSELLTTSNWLNTVIHLCDALKHVHEKGILHNDIKADNIVLVKEENIQMPYSPILVDFGKSKHMADVQKKNLSDTEKEIYRKRHFHIAPEVIDGSHTPSVKSDVYSIGLVFCKIYKLVKVKNLKDLCKKCIEPYNDRCTSNELREMAERLSL